MKKKLLFKCILLYDKSIDKNINIKKKKINIYFACFTLVQKKIISNTFVYLTMKYIHAFKKYINISKEEFSLSSYPDNRFP